MYLATTSEIAYDLVSAKPIEKNPAADISPSEIPPPFRQSLNPCSPTDVAHGAAHEQSGELRVSRIPRTSNARSSSRAMILMLLTGWVSLCQPTDGRADEKTPYPGAACQAALDVYFADEVWAKVAETECLKCHKPGGDAEDTRLVLKDIQRTAAGSERTEAMRHNRDAFAKLARIKEVDESRLLLKVVGKLEHGGEQVLKPDSAGYRVLAEFVRRLHAPPPVDPLKDLAEDKNSPPFFQNVVMLDDRQLLRRVTLSLAGRLPTDDELRKVAAGGLAVMPELLDAVLKEEAFYTRLREAFNDIFLTVGQEDNAETVLSYDHFSNTRLWYQKHDLSHIADEKERRQAGYKLANDYRKAILDEPMRLVDYIVRNERPFTEIVIADYIMVTPYSSRGYGVFDELKEQFKNPDDPFEYVPVKLKALIGRNKIENQESETGFYPHAGLISTFQYLRRYPTTETNRNRQRARVYYQHFLGVDVLELAARVSDAASVSAKFEIPTMQASECVVCHRTLDPVAGLFQDYWKFEGVYGRRKGGWFTDMFAAGFEGETLPENERWRALQWLGERTAKDPRFATTMVEHAYYLLTGRKTLLPPKDLDDPLYAAQRRAYREQRKQIEAIAERFSKNGYNFKQVIKDWIISDFYRADGLATAAADPARRAELNDLGLMRMLAPEQVERKVEAVFGKPWGRLTEQMAMLYGGIDSKEVTERATDPSGAMGAIQRILSNDVACKHTALDFSRPASDRRLFPDIEPDVLPGVSPEADAQIRRAIVHLHLKILGRYDTVDSPEVERTFQLFTGILADAGERKTVGKSEIYHCRQGLERPLEDPKYTIRAWRGVVTYLLRQPDFLYE